MRLLSWLLCAAAAIIPVTSSEEKSLARPKRDSSEKKIVCYYTNWSVYRPGTAKFSPQNINPYLCTHLIYAFGGLSKDNALKPFDKYQDIEQGGYAKFNGLKTYNKNLKTMLAIGGWNEGSARFSPLVADAERRRELVKNTVKFLRQNHFDGLDLDWEYPSFRDGGKPRDRDNYATLVQEFREEFERESEKTGRPRLLLTMAVPAGIEYIDKGYDVPKLNKYLDWMNILSYDYHSAFEPAINHHSPLFSLEEDDEYNFDAQLSIDYTVKHYIKLGADKNKLVLGIPTYGRSYTLFNPDATDIGSPADGPGEQGEATREKGYLAYYEICERVSSGGWTEENPYPEAMGPYAYKDNQWVGYDDEGIARAKAKYVNDNDLGGIMFWSIDNDDFRGKCHGKPYPIIEAAKEALLASANELVPTSSRSESTRSNSKKQEQSNSKTKTRVSRLRAKSSTTTEASKGKLSGRTTTTPQPPTTPDPGSDFVCKDEGFFPHPRDCKKYFWCLDSGPSSLGIVAHQFTCPSGLVFNKISDSCDYARNVICKNKAETSTTTTTTTTTTSTTTTAKPTTVRSRLVITASPPKSTTTTTTEHFEEEEVEEEEEEDEEDPGTIKELISLIKKLGGVEQLEKQLNLQNSDTKEKIKPSLYSKVLQGRTGNKFRGVTNGDPTTTQKYVSVFRNRPVGPQSVNSEESSTRNQDRPKYVTIQRNKSTKRPSQYEGENESEDEIEDEPELPKSKKEEAYKSFRRRPSSDVTTEKEYVTLRRSRPPKNEEDFTTTSKYRNVIRVKSSTEAFHEEDEASTDVEEEDERENEDDAVDEEIQDEAKEDSAQKFKKYSSIKRDKKLGEFAAEDEEKKVSGPQGAKHEGEISSPTTENTFYGRNDDVNTVYKAKTPKYVEIRRFRPTSTTSSDYDVNNVYNSPGHVQEEKKDEDESEKVDGFQSRSTTAADSGRRSARPQFRSSAVFASPPMAEITSRQNEIQNFRGRFTSSTEQTSALAIRSPFNRYKTINRSNAEKPVLSDDDSVSRFSVRGRTTFSTTTPTSTTTNAPLLDSSSNSIQRRFQFAPRTKPTILTPKAIQSTAKTFTIITVDPPVTENALSPEAPFPSFLSVTLEPTTIAPFISDEESSSEPEDDVNETSFVRTRPSTRRYIPTTSTQTSVVTSITESLFTQRGRILIPKRGRENFQIANRFNKTGLAITTEFAAETTRTPLRATRYKTINRTTFKPETSKETDGRRFKGKQFFSTSTTTEKSEPRGSRYVPKRGRNTQKIASTESPSSTSTTLYKTRFSSQSKFRLANDQDDSVQRANSVSQRFFGNTRKRKINSQKADEDLSVEQTETQLLESKERQSSDLKSSNAGVVFSSPITQRANSFLRTTSREKEDEEKVNLLEKNETRERGEPSYATSRKARIRPPYGNNVRDVLKTSNQFQRTTPFANSHFGFSATISNIKNFTVDTVNNASLNEEKQWDATTTSFTDFDADNSESTELDENFNKKTLGDNRRETFQSNTSNKLIVSPRIESSAEFPAKITNLSNLRTSKLRNENLNSYIKRLRSTTPPATTKSKSTVDEEDAKSEKDLNRSTFKFSRTRIKRPLDEEREPEEQTISTSGLKSKQSNPSAGFNQNLIRGTERGVPAIDLKLIESDDSGEKYKSNFKKFSNRIVKSSKPTESEVKSSPQEKYYEKKTSEEEIGEIAGSVKLSGGTVPVAQYKTVKTKELGSTFDLLRSKIPNIRSPGIQSTSTVASEESYSFEFDGDPNYKSSSRPEPTGTLKKRGKPSSSGSTTYILDPLLGSTFGLKTGVSLGVTKSLLSSPLASTKRPATLGSTSTISLSSSGSSLTHNSPAVAGISAESTYDSISSASIDSAVRISDGQSTTAFKSSSNPEDANKSGTLTDYTVQTSRLPFDSTNPWKSSTTANPGTNYSSVIEKATIGQQPDQPKTITENSSLSNSSRSNFRAFRPKFSGNFGLFANEAASAEVEQEKKFKTSNGNYSRNNSDEGKKVLLKGKFIKTRRLETSNKSVRGKNRTKEREKEEEDDDEDEEEGNGDAEDLRTEVPPTTAPVRSTSGRKAVQDHFIGARNRARSTTTQAPTTERQERRRTLLDRRRLKQDYRSTTVKPETPSETYSSTVRSAALLRRRNRPSTSTTTSTTSTTTTSTTTTEAPYLEVQEDSSLEESKTLDESPGIQDLADPAVVAIHTLATVAPGSLASPGRSLTYFATSPGTPDTYTVHVTPGDIESITPARIATISPGTVRPTSILTLKPFTIPVITKTPAKQTAVPIRAPSPFRVNGIQLVTEEPYVSRDDLLEQARRLEAIAKQRPLNPVTASSTRKSARPKPFSKVPKQEIVQSVSSPDPGADYEYYDEDDPLASIPASALKVKVHSNGYIECLDRGNFPHPFSCKKFISCAKMENNELLGWEYTCPKHLSFDPVGGICNWSAGLGCQH